MDDIEKLKEKVEKDPASTLFVPLAEKYRQAGQLDEAIEVLKKGIEYQPGYMSGRVALGKIYLEKDMKAEAKVEFEQVVISIPDNIFAQRKLADIYKDTGDIDSAILQYQKVLELHPADEEVQLIIRQLKGEEPVPEEEAPQELKGAEPVEEEIIDTAEEEAEVAYEEEAEVAYGEEAEVAYGEEAEVAYGEEAEVAYGEEAEVAYGEEAEVAYGEEAEVAYGEEVEVAYGEEAEVAYGEEAEVAYGEEIEVAYEEEIEVAYEEEAGEGLIEEEASAGIPIGELESFEPPYSEEAVAEEETPEKSERELESELEELSRPVVEGVAPGEVLIMDLGEADKSIQDGDYIRAFNIYKEYLSKDPENKSIIQKVQELKGLMKLLGKENEIIEARLDSFLNKIKSHRDEFLRSS